jgi:hypothetical protein
MENQLKALKEENTQLKAQVYDLSMEVKGLNGAVSHMANSIMKSCGIEPTEENITIQDILDKLAEKLAVKEAE